MPKYIDVFNGDADGLCALLQLRLAEPLVSPASNQRVTGVKRDNALLRHVNATAGDLITVLDINFDVNRADVLRLLEAGAQIRYFDHHSPGALVQHTHLQLTIDESADVCTALLVNQALQGRFLDWAICGAFGDNLPQVATALAEQANYSSTYIAQLRELGELLNYNGYASDLADLHFHPAVLFERLLAAGDPVSFITHAPEFAVLKAGHASDIAAASALQPAQQNETAAVYVLPDQAWSRRVIGVWANELSQAAKQRAHLIFCPDGNGTFTASLRSARTPHQTPSKTAAAFCKAYPGGGGRAQAAGITRLPVGDVDIVAADFISTFS